MAKLKAEKLLTLFEELAEKMQINIVQGKGDFKGGICSVNEETYIVLNKIKPIDQRLNVLAKEFGKLNTNNIFVQPVLRAYMEDIQQDIF
ncbi:MAG: hypothetical protein ISR82_06710 [Candidatus Marinimicrobia bacterium]|nr:hypothetical protein [Candidatus Neomarinimicrobiota bacterium]MBL7010896.1 hypothetical protein [Candidatus Neomarinimicrobiota bacterium]MBL7030275.1 hypothetical protein [Candidatus Neomarinimicrobiota bacterium]